MPYGFTLTQHLFLLIFISLNGNKNEGNKNDFNEGSVVVLDMSPEKLKEPEPIKEKPKSTQAVAQLKYTSQIKIVENEKTDVAEITNVAEKIVSSMNVAGELPADPNEKIITAEKNNGDKKAIEPEIKNDFKQLILLSR